MDALRRRREATFVRQLERLTARDQERGGQQRSALIKRDRGKVGVLQDAVDLITRLEDLNNALTRACNAQEDRIQAMSAQLQLAIHSHSSPSSSSSSLAPPSDADGAQESASSSAVSPSIFSSSRSVSSSSSSRSGTAHPLAALPQRVSELLSYFSQRHSLYASVLGYGHIHLLLVDAETGIGLDANEAYFGHSHYSRQQVTHKLLTAPYDWIMAAEQAPSLKRKRASAPRASPAAADDEVAQGVPQYPRSVAQMRELFDKRRSVASAVWRCKMGDDRVYEQRWLSWVAKWDMVVDDSGRVVQRPMQVVYAGGFDEAVVLDSWDIAPAL